MKPRALRLSIVTTLILCFASTGCAAEESSFCQSAREFQTAVTQVEAEELVDALGPEFWQELDSLLSEIAASDSGEVGTLAGQLQVELRQFIARLEAVEYNLVAAALDPELASLFVDLVNDLLDYSTAEIGLVVDEQCR
jgi:hypothetical protein